MKIIAIVFCCVVYVPAFAMAGEDIFSAARTKLKYLNQRQSVLSQNIANANTPAYKAKDLAPLEFKGLGKGNSGVSLRTTSAGHVKSKGLGPNFKSVRLADAYETAPDGNNVVLEQQMVKMAENDMEYRATASVLKQLNGLLRTAIGRR